MYYEISQIIEQNGGYVKYTTGIISVVAILVLCSSVALADDHTFYKPWFNTVGYEISSHGCPTFSVDAARYHRGPQAAGIEVLKFSGVMPWLSSGNNHCSFDQPITSFEFAYHYGYPHPILWLGYRPFLGIGLKVLQEHGNASISISVFASFNYRKWYLPADSRIRIGASISSYGHAALFMSVSYWIP